MANYKDFDFSAGEYGKASEYYDSSAIAVAIKNILLSRPGNFPMHPSLGMNIRKYQFEFLDDVTIKSIQNELKRSIGLYIPDASDVEIQVLKKTDNKNQPYLGIFVSIDLNGQEVISTFVVRNEQGMTRVYNETL